MIELNSKTSQDFLNRIWVRDLLNIGVNMDDAKYVIYNAFNGKDYITAKDQLPSYTTANDIVPTYTISELLYKLHEYVYPIINDKEYSGGLKFLKDAPFYIWYYSLKSEGSEDNENYLYAEAEHPIESLAMLLIQCYKKDIGLAHKDTGNISDKWG